MQTTKQKREYHRKWVKSNPIKYKEYYRLYKEAQKEERYFVPELHKDTEQVLKNLPNPFGTFEKAKYMICANNCKEPFYFFTTTCRNTEDCIEIMKQRFIYKYAGQIKLPNFCIIYKIVGGVEEIIFKDSLKIA